MIDKPDIINVLQDAQLAHQAGDFVSALNFYEQFFDHALDDDPYALYGVRLSHCLQGWAELAMEFPGAKKRLEAKKHETLGAYVEERQPEQFHDYLSICRHLGLEAEALAQFLELHHGQPKSAAKLVKYVWDDLILGEYWDVCNQLLTEPSAKLSELFAVFDEAGRLKDIDPAFDNAKFEQHIVDTLLNDVQKLVEVLRHGNRADEIEGLQHQFSQGLSQREHSELHKQAHAKSSFLFAGH
ncbi:MAG: hypothetical protein AAF431_02990 [Pseudomonadota bacterium]